MNIQERYKELNSTAVQWGVNSPGLFFKVFLKKHTTRYRCSKDYVLKDSTKFYLENKEDCFLRSYSFQDEKSNYDFLYFGDNIYLSSDEDGVAFHFFGDENIPKIEEFIKQYCEEPKKKSNSLINLLQFSHNEGYYLKEYAINDNSDLDLSDNYNADLLAVDNQVYKYLNSEKKSMTIFHGLPGCGKTTYLRYLISKLMKNKKRIVYLPPNVTQILSQPDFMSSLELFKDCVVIIEDAENVLVDEGKRSQAISNILNITDGMIADIFNIHFIFTFNVDIRNIDPALLRKGRLTLKYEFKELEADKTKALCQKLGVEYNSGRTLAEIYNTDDNLVQKSEKGAIGFLSK